MTPREIIAAATCGPWTHDGASHYVDMPNGLKFGAMVLNSAADARFIAAAREGWSEALDECDRLRIELQALRGNHRRDDNHAGAVVMARDAAIETLRAEVERLREFAGDLATVTQERHRLKALLVEACESGESAGRLALSITGYEETGSAIVEHFAQLRREAGL